MTDKKDYTLDSLIRLAHDPYLPAFKVLIPGLVRAYDSIPAPNLEGTINLLRSWNYKTSESSSAMTLAHYYGTKCLQWGYSGKMKKFPSQLELFENFENEVSVRDQLTLFESVVTLLEEDFGTWEIPWGEVNRYQRLDGDIRQAFDDAKPSIPIGFASGRWGALAAYGARYDNDTKKIYGTRGNSFVAAVEFGEKVKAKTILAGGQSGSPNSPHFNDQIEMYANVNWKDAAYYKEDVLKRAKETYSPGEKN